MEKVIIFDTTLRDGEQAPGYGMNIAEKLQVARQLEKLNVDVIEPGFPAASEGDFTAVKEVARTLMKCEIAGLARAIDRDIDRAWEAVKDAVKPRLKIVLSTSDIHLKYQLCKTREEVLEMAIGAVKRAKAHTPNVEFSAMDATRSDREYLAEVIEAAIDAGATTINIPDTVGYAVPSEYGMLIKYLKEKVKSIDRVVISVHCHNDLGLAVANSLSGVLQGARQVECTVNGIGERAGNASLEEIVMILRTRKNIFKLNTGVVSEMIFPTSRLITRITGIRVHPNKAIVGVHAFDHKSGFSLDNRSKGKMPFEIITPQTIGMKRGSGTRKERSSRHGCKRRLP
jgi:2-isopropylmalate synthase